MKGQYPLHPDLAGRLAWEFFRENNNQMLSGVWRPTLSKAIKPTGNVMLDAWETLPNIRYDQMFKEFGCHPELVEKDAQIKPTLKRACDYAMKEKKPAFGDTGLPEGATKIVPR